MRCPGCATGVEAAVDSRTCFASTAAFAESTRSPKRPARMSEIETRSRKSSSKYFDTTFPWGSTDRKSTRLNSSHLVISYAAFCLTKHQILHGPLTLHTHRQYPRPCSPLAVCL